MRLSFRCELWIKFRLYLTNYCVFITIVVEIEFIYSYFIFLYNHMKCFQIDIQPKPKHSLELCGCIRRHN